MVQSRKSASFDLRAEERAPLSVMVSRQLRRAIVTGKVGMGTELPSEKELVRELGVGRSTVREALRILQAQGLVSGGDTVSTKRPRVSNEKALGDAVSLAMENALALGQVPLGDLVELRVLLEGAAVASAARREERAIEAAHEAVRTMKEKGIDVETFRAADLAFHHALVLASGNAAFPLLMGVIRQAVSNHLGEALDRVKSPRLAMSALAKEHEAILAAVEKGKPQLAEKLVSGHIRDFYRKSDA
jgi:DNA-binding FadR family transcriptional regulator